jgi:cytidylate kinase
MGTQVVTISAPFGTGGNTIGPAVAGRLGLPFVDRAIPAQVAQSLAVPATEALAHDERAEVGFRRFLSALALVGTSLGPVPVPEDAMAGTITEETYRERTERVIKEMAETTGGVILGRAAMIVLRDFPRALHVCLDGAFDDRVRQARALGGYDEAGARSLLEDADRAREAYFRHLYRADPRDPRLYHLIIDSTALDFDSCVDVIVRAAEGRNA